MLLWILCDVAQATVDAGGNFIPRETHLLERLVSLVGIFLLVGLAWLLSEKRREIRWRPVLWGVGLQLVFGAIVLSPAVSDFFYTVINGAVNQLLAWSAEGSHFLFGSTEPHYILMPDGTQQTFAGKVSPPVKTFAFWILPTVIFFSSLMSLLYYLGVMQILVKAVAWLMVRTLGTSGSESLSAAGNIFVGQTEAPLLVRPYIDRMTRSELMAIMTGGFATVSGGVMGAYVLFLQGIPDIAGHLVIASIISAPAALAIAKVMVPETEESDTAGVVKINLDRGADNVMEAAARGATDGMKLALNIAAMLIAFVALVAMFDWFVGWIPVTLCEAGPQVGYTCGLADGSAAAGEPITLSWLFGLVFAPIAIIMGVPWSESLVVGRLLGEKIMLTEFIAYMSLGNLIHAETAVLSERSAIIASYALCGFANFASIGVQLGGIGGIAPKRMKDLASLGLRAMTAGVLAACMTGAIAGIFL